MLFLREQVSRSLTGPGLAPGSHAGFKLLDNFLGYDFIDARHCVRSSVSYCFQVLSGHKKQHALLEASSGRDSRLSSPKAHFSVARRGAEASTVGFYRAELHKRALQ